MDSIHVDMPVDGLNARERSRLETRRRLLETGERLFLEHGAAHTRASDIAKAAGVAVGTLYLHFHDKHGLLRAILFEGTEELLMSLRQLAEHPPDDLEQAVRTQIELIIRFAEERPKFCRLLFDPESARANIRNEIGEYLATMQERRLREDMAKGRVSRGMDPLVASHAYVGMFLWVMDWWIRSPGKVARETVAETLALIRLA